MDNPAELAKAYTDSTNTTVFLTGKAGTGKTTFLRQLRQSTRKRMAIVAPTGVAAINAGGMTIHSMFQLLFGPLPPDLPDRPELKYNDDKRDLLQELELLVIDEISMVRPDVLDQIDIILRNVRDNRHHFGGVQLLLIGDLAQLSPVIRDGEWAILRSHYATPYFFSSIALRHTDYVRIELDKVYRQTDEDFIRVLNEMREQRLSAGSLALLNRRYTKNFRPPAGEGYITLTTHNKAAQKINREWLDAIEEEVTEYKATIRGEFPADAFPADTLLKLKTGAQVMFVKNDSSPEKRYYNGKIGTVLKLTPDTVYVSTPDGNEIEVQAQEWLNIRYRLDDGQVSEENAGSFAQIPLKTAWAITIHKSQGLTFEKAVIDVSAAFTHGQAYVALSRCRSLAGLMLLQPVTVTNVIGDPAVSRFNKEALTRKPDTYTLSKHRETYRLFLLSELFSFSDLAQRAKKFGQLLPDVKERITDVAVRLQKRLAAYPDDRIRKAAEYFHTELSRSIVALQQGLPALIGTSKELAARADELTSRAMDRLTLLETFMSRPFQTGTYLELQRSKKQKHIGYLQALNSRPNEKLIAQLTAWREVTAKNENVLPSMLFSEQTLAAVAAKLPETIKALSSVKGVGAQKGAQFGPQLIALIRAYKQEISGFEHEQTSLF